MLDTGTPRCQLWGSFGRTHCSTAGHFASFLSEASSLAVLADNGITANNTKVGVTQMAARTKANSGSSLARRGKEGKTDGNLDDCTAFVVRMTVW